MMAAYCMPFLHLSRSLQSATLLPLSREVTLQVCIRQHPWTFLPMPSLRRRRTYYETA